MYALLDGILVRRADFEVIEGFIRPGWTIGRWLIFRCFCCSKRQRPHRYSHSLRAGSITIYRVLLTPALVFLFSNTSCNLNSVLAEVSSILPDELGVLVTHRYTGRLVTLYQRALIYQVWIPLHFCTQLLLSLPTFVLVFPSAVKTSSIGAVL